MKKTYTLIILLILYLNTRAQQKDNIPVATVEYQALVDFYNAVNGDNWSNKWDISNNDINTGNWYGVTSENGHITEISLRSNRVRGAIPASFGDLKYLRRLDLYGYRNSNDLSTTDLNSLSGLESLEYLDLSYCKLTGSIPASWTQLTQLKTLKLNNNSLEGAIFNEIGELTALEFFDVGANQFTSIPSTISNLINLKTFIAYNNKINGSLIKDFEALTSLTSLQLYSNELSDIDAFLTSSVSLNINSQRLIVDDFTYRGEDIVFTSLPRIVNYDRNNNDFSHLPTFRVYLRNSNQGNVTMAADGSLTIPKEYLASMKPGDDIYLQQSNGTLSSTTIRFRTITIDLPAVPDEEYQALVDFYTATNGANWSNQWPIETNNLNEGAWYGITLESGHITGISLRSNRVRGAIPASFGDLKYLKRLDLYGYRNSNDLSTTDLNSLSGLESLEYLDLSYCKLTGSIPVSWAQLTQLKTLKLNNNSLEGAIFNEIGELTALEIFDVGANQFTSIPSTIGNLINLKTFTAYNNKISGSLIKAFEDLTSLTSLQIYGNELSNIDAFLTSSVSLGIYSQRLTVNDFTYRGEDVVFTSLPRIVSYDRNNNDFSHLPTFWVYLRNSNQGDVTMTADGSLTIPKEYLASMKPGDDIYLQQSNGTLSSTTIRFRTITIDLPAVPDAEYQALVDFYTATNGANWSNQWPIETNNLNEGAWYGITLDNGHITGISLRSNRVRGAIPASFGDLKYLKRLDLYGYRNSNDLSTTDLNSLSGLESLEYLDLSYCKLTGSIPASWAKLTQLKSLYLTNNAFEDAIFNEIGELTALEIIDVGANQFTSIPNTIGNLINLKTFTAYNNKINGSLIKAFEALTSLTSLQIYGNELSDIDAFLTSSVSLGIYSQRLTVNDFTYRGEDVVFTSLPRIVSYDRNNNDFSHLPTFWVYLRGSNQGDVTMTADGSLTIPKEYLASMKPGDDIYLQQRNGTLGSTTIRFRTITIDLPAVPDAEYQALVDFYTATNGANWSNQWPIETNNLNEGAWYGITLDNGHITGISLRSNRVRGAIPASFGDLKYLKRLDLYGYRNSNDLSTTDLNSLSGLESLEYLDLSYCKLTGSIPVSWAQLTQLKTLNLYGNAIENIDGSFNSLKPESLNFQYQNLTFETIEISGGKIFLDLPRYMTIKLIDGNITFDANNEFRLYVNGVSQRTAFSNDGQLIFSNLSQLGIEETDAIRVLQVNGIAGNSNINYNAVSFGRPLVDEEFEILKKIYTATDGANWSNTWDITINNVNQISWHGVAIQDGHVIGLDLFNNQLSGTIPEEITGLTYLKNLNLSTNDLSGTLPVNLDSLTQLEFFDVTSNQLSGAITPNISSLQNLKKFAIGNNQFKGAIPTAFSDFEELEYLDISSNSFDRIDKRLYYDFSVTYIDLRNQKIKYDEILSLNDSQLKVTLSDIVKYDLENNNFDAKNGFSLLVDNLTHDTTVLNDSGEIIFDNVRIAEIPADASIAVRQTTGSFLNTEFSFTGIEDKSNIPVIQEEYLALVSLFQNLNGETWTNTWDTSSNNLHVDRWFGVTTYDGHIVGINLRNNNVSGTIPDIFGSLSFLTELDVSSNQITSIEGTLPTTINLSIDRQNQDSGILDLSLNSIIVDTSINRYDQEQQSFVNQTYTIAIDGFSKTVNMPEEGIKLIDLKTYWEIPNGQKLTLRQNSGDAINSLISYDLTFTEGDANLDSTLNVLDIQTTINHILSNYVQYFNYYGADITNDNIVNVLDLTAQVNAIQSRIPGSKKAQNINNSVKNEVNAVDNLAYLGIDHGELFLDTNGHEVTSFEIILEGTTEEKVEEMISDLGFSVSVKENQNLVSIVAFSINSYLDNLKVLAKIIDDEVSIVNAILSNQEAIEIPFKIISETLGVNDFDPLVDNEPVRKAKNFPNPFSQQTTLVFASDYNYFNTTLLIFDLTGRKVIEEPINSVIPGENLYLFDRKSKLSSGTYLYKIILNPNNPSQFLEGKLIIN